MRTDRIDADREQAELYAAGRAATRGAVRMRQHLQAGDPARAAMECHHGYGYATSAPCAATEQDPRAGQPGHRCCNCGSWWNAEAIRPVATSWGGVSFTGLRRIPPTAPCEIPPKA